MADLNFDDLRCHYQTGRSYVISGEGRNRVYGYRNGVKCNLGDIEQIDWCQMVKDAIQTAGEQMLFKNLLQHLRDHNYAKESAKELEFKALQLHASRIFDNQEWVDFLKFNSRYRPEVVATTRLASVIPRCCKKPGVITQLMLDSSKHKANRICCPHCGRWVHYETTTAKEC